MTDLSTRVDETIHELNNRLTVIAGRASLMRSMLPGPSQGEVDAILEAVRGCQVAIHGLRSKGANSRARLSRDIEPVDGPLPLAGDDAGSSSAA